MSLLIGITQRVSVVPEYGERRDALDQAWVGFFSACNLDPLIIPNRLADPVAYAQKMGVKGIVLTGGNNFSDAVKTIQNLPVRNLPQSDDLAPERDATEIALLKQSIEKGWPVIGVCRGMQLLNLFYGGEIGSVENHVGLYHDLTTKEKIGIPFEVMFDNPVNSFHDFGIHSSGMSPEFNILAQTGDVVESFVHREYPHMGIMWHPERNVNPSVNDVNLFRNYFACWIKE
ncbi:gamma-glutamyl-gamma-aminobutyrate hydrolase family protein [candidate division KSB1 bacterium]|nr:gamma-glutamyl-gamma-aminobutyrate hydrolase family protein [candidate division KSB1 bacterium]